MFESYIMALAIPIQEMCVRGLPLDETKRQELIAEFEGKVQALMGQLSQEINTRSPKQKLKLFTDKGYKIPKKRDPATQGYRPSVDELSLKKLRLQHPEDSDLKTLIEIAHLEKALSSYLKIETHGRSTLHYMLDGHGTETGRFSCSKDPWGAGCNAQTLPKYAKKMIRWPENTRTFVQVDLKQAESRFVAYDAPEPTLMTMLEDPSKDVHKFVASNIYRINENEVTKAQRQLGKKSGHGANYAMQATTFQESCLKEMDLVIDKKEAQHILNTYHQLFPGLRQWHRNIEQAVRATRKLATPFGRIRYFYGRMDDNTFREAFAYRPQSSIPDVTNHLMLHLIGARQEGKLDFWLHNQVHDSLVMSCRNMIDVERIAEFCLNLDLWHPEIVLKGGRLRIPTEVEVGTCLGELEVFHPQ